MADHRHKRDTDARRLFGIVSTVKTVSFGLAALATTAVVAVGVITAPMNDPTDLAGHVKGDLTRSVVAADAAGIPGGRPTMSASADGRERFVVSRSASRKSSAKEKKAAVREARADGALAATATAVRQAQTRLWTTTDLNLWTQSADDAVQVGLLEGSRKVLVTGREAGGRVEVVIDGKSRWVTDGYLSEDKPVEVEVGAGAGLSMAPCPHSGESGLTSDAVLVFRSVCHAFPQITSYGGLSNHGEHVSGRAIDIMVSDVALGTAIAEFLRSHAAELNLYDILWRQHIWTPVRAGEGWRYLSNRGSATANHYDHVHVSVY